ncbi:hypothetical protein QN219_32440 [Sinorhizobium sp. 7-81]|uniref:hypothetical protein n=1 Tax=Sinorhizobium sp. 8-89 TaxID=3049089 RepID=UPI0024C2580F|nr:hypothetical protein [Sinorhizobium sp. 8-89]MDK1494630.1 hypothetical protein [Sinorhizobium sp. 8-89]
MNIPCSDYIKDCREYALRILDRGDIQNAVASLMGDMKRIPHATSVMPNIGAIIAVARGDFDAARAYIEGFE